jgi:hypothetical protein
MTDDNPTTEPLEPLEPGWQKMHIWDLRAWVRRSPYFMPHLNYTRKADLIAWLEQELAENDRGLAPEA